MGIRAGRFAIARGGVREHGPWLAEQRLARRDPRRRPRGRRIMSGVREGPFLRQYVRPGFTDLRGLALSEGGGVLYVLTGDGVRAFGLEPGGGAQ